MQNMSGKKYVIDIDGTICTQCQDYAQAEPILENIAKFNKLYNEGNTIVYYPARGTETGIDWMQITLDQFKSWGVLCNQLLFGKPSADYYIDDKAVNIKDFKGDDD